MSKQVTTEEVATKAPGKIAALHALWEEAGEGSLLPRAFAIEMAVASGVNPSTARTQYQVWFSRAQLAELVEPPVQ